MKKYNYKEKFSKRWPCYNPKTNECVGTGNKKDYPTDEDVKKWCESYNLLSCNKKKKSK